MPVLGSGQAMRRRDFIKGVAGSATAWPLAARAQQAGKLRTIGFLGSNASAWRPWTDAFVGRLGELGWIEGRTITIEYRWSEGREARLAEIAAEVVRLNVDVICREWNRRLHSKAGDISNPNRLSDRGRSGRRRLCRKSGATGRQRHWALASTVRC